ncbi:9805_t:CDS:2 [Acaulospora morrowiae]|uniref:9805_t:CDS:1 n=1 Tax=Acaulospora morrowiae TaxID=94023 RepID=A0A9N9BMB9_9GLOM|nr:9805_t:CDS:2 [Acaulospora morrowiae]
MELTRFDYIAYASEKVIKKIIKGLHTSLEVNIKNHSTLLLHQPEFFTTSNINDLAVDDIGSSKTDTAKISGGIVSRGILSFEVKTKMKRGKNSITVSIMNKKPERNSSQKIYGKLHTDDKRKYAGDNIDFNDPYYRISGSITDG